MPETGQLPELRGTRVSEDERGNICLNDLWKLAGSPPTRRPVDWRRSVRAQALEGALRDRMVEILHHSENILDISVFYVEGRGRASRPYAHPVLALHAHTGLGHSENVRGVLGRNHVIQDAPSPSRAKQACARAKR